MRITHERAMHLESDPPPPLIAFAGPAVALLLSLIAAVTAVVISDAYTAKSLTIFAISGAVILCSAAILAAGLNRRRRYIYELVDSGLKVAAYLRQDSMVSEAHHGSEHSPEEDLFEIQHALSRAGAYREALEVANAYRRFPLWR